MAITIPTMGQPVPGQFDTAAFWNANVKALGDFLLGVPVFYGYQTTTQSILTGTPTAINIDTEVLDSASGHSNTSNPSRYVPQAPGVYYVIATVAWASGPATASYRRAWVRVNGGNQKGLVGSIDQSSPVTCAVTAQGLVQCNGTTDYIECFGAQATGSNLATTSNSDYASALTVFWVSK